MNYFDNKIDQFATYLQKRNNLDHIQFLQVRLGMQIIVGNFFKILVTYSISIFLNIFLFTLITNLTFYLIRRHAHGAHAPSSFWCYVESIILFILLPLVIVNFHINFLIMIILTVISLGVISVYAPAATKKKPIPVRLIKRKKYYAIIVSLTLFIITLIIKEPFAQFIQLGIIIEAITLLPIFFIKEDLK
ncbi:histidine kinase [Staphylococcus aureus]|nr:histidine kinase [Staphylococcus aureus]